MPNFEKFNLSKSRQFLEKNKDFIDSKAEEVQNEIETLSEDFNAENIPVDNRCGINMKAYKDKYAPEKLEKDYKYIEKAEKEFARIEGLTVEQWKKSKDKRNGERFEQLKTVILNRNFETPNIIAIRASDYDDYKNSIDNIIINKNTGDIICALDAIANDKNSKRYKEKEEKIKEINEKGGAKLKYGITFEDDKPVLKEIKGVNIFILSLSSRELYEALKNFGSGKFENKLFKEFGKQAIEQLQKLPSNVPQSVKENWITILKN
ncbi:MAG: hypothetical protein QGG63_01865 [Candidatus Pacebacteria bacterium]|jgi:hypothetical protein|nr:hypothetical protein [Candidatus Paceibacterota bacterium]|tara:strand:- start:58308 stop:59099 length:792 start_codon:yes stop_codon:yes gene_type:complete